MEMSIEQSVIGQERVKDKSNISERRSELDMFDLKSGDGRRS
jgi:hypothetical protein